MIAIAEYALDDPYLRMPREDRIALRQERKARLELTKLAKGELSFPAPEPVEIPAPVETPTPQDDAIQAWVERQKAIPIKKAPWFSVEDDLGPVGPRTPLVDEIIAATAQHYKFSMSEMLATRRFAPIVRARQVAMHLAKTLTMRSLPEIGRRFGGMDHTTILHAVRKIESLRQTDSKLENDLQAIAAAVGGSLDR